MHYPLDSSFGRFQERRGLLLSLSERLLNLLEMLDIPALWSELQQTRDQFDTHSLKILVAGELHSGKSTIVNALLRTKVLPAYPVPTTALLTQIKRGGQAMAFLHHRPSSDGRQQPPLEVALTDIERYLVLNQQREQAREFEWVEIHLPLPPAYKGIEITDPVSPWDEDGYEESLASQVPAADAILYTMDSDALPSKEEALRIDWICGASHALLFFLCNRFDLIEPHSQKMVRRRYFAYLSQLAHQNKDFIFFTGAKEALEGYLQGDMQRVEQSHMPEVEDALYDYLAEGSGRQSLLRAVANLQAIVSATRRIISVKNVLQQAPLAICNEVRAMLTQQCSQLETRRQHIAGQFCAVRQGTGKEAQIAAADFYRACLDALEHVMRNYTPRHTDSLWHIFSGDSSERLAKDIITFLAETQRDQFQAWITSTLEPLLQQELCSIDAELLQDMVRQIAQAVERRVNFLWHPSILIKRMLEDALLEPGSDSQEMQGHVVSVYRRELEVSTASLVDAITKSIDSKLCQRQQELDHLLEVEHHCLSDVVRTSLTQERDGMNATMRLLPDLKDELDAIEHTLNNLL